MPLMRILGSNRVVSLTVLSSLNLVFPVCSCSRPTLVKDNSCWHFELRFQIEVPNLEEKSRFFRRDLLESIAHNFRRRYIVKIATDNDKFPILQDLEMEEGLESKD